LEPYKETKQAMDRMSRNLRKKSPSLSRDGLTAIKIMGVFN